ncbi:hypothetical protein XENTR_v10024650 [Xenopus tropicalis]|nr:hypothetical protein XENTR_v10024650 [Xenopus tropicalis]
MNKSIQANNPEYSVFQKRKKSIIFSFIIAATVFLTVLHSVALGAFNPLAKYSIDNGIKEDVQKSTSAPEVASEGKEAQASREQVSQPTKLTSIQSRHGEKFNEIIQLMNDIAEMATKNKEDDEEFKAQVKNIHAEMENLKKEIKELKAQVAELQTSKCDKEGSLFLEILSRLFPKIRLDLFSIPLIDLRQIFRLF